MRQSAQNPENIEMKRALQVKEYAADINLFDDYKGESHLLNINEKEKLVDEILLQLYAGIEEFSLTSLGSYNEKRELLHGVINTLQPQTLDSVGLDKLNTLLQGELLNKEITDTNDLLQLDGFEMGNTPIKMWHGDICTLKVDAIVNSANSQMLGCWEPLHNCVDNRIHSAAGVQMRDDCQIIMQKQGFEEPTGRAKITRAYNLPSQYVLHTVGPVVEKEVSSLNEEDLANCYIHCLEVCKQVKDIRSIAFSSISTEEGGYPDKDAAQLAIRIVSLWLEKNPTILDLVVFTVSNAKENTTYKNIFNKL